MAQAALEKQAEGVVMLDLRALSNVTDFFVVATAGSGRQLDALKQHLEVVLEQRGCPIWHAEGLAAATAAKAGAEMIPRWLLLDFGDVVVHLFDQDARTFYRLEELWADAPRIAVPAALPASSRGA